MKKLTINELKPGMLAATPIYSKKGQLLIPAHTVMSVQHISRLAYYQIDSAFVLIPEEETLPPIPQEAPNPVILSHSKKIKNSPEFHHFKASYTEKISFVTDSLNDIITNSKPVDQEKVLNQVTQLFQENTTSLSVFDMLHNMREIDDSTYVHSVNVAIISRMLGQWLKLSHKELDLLTISGIYHDIGKCRISPSIIQKPGKLTDEEYDEIKKHPLLGYEILKAQQLDYHIKTAALMHHERSDGTGYPMGLSADKIDPFAQIISIADVYDAMTANRCYRDGLCPFEVIATFEYEGLDKYNPRFILTFLEHIADTYMHNDVVLSDGQMGSIVLINRQQLSRPVIELTDGSFVNLLEHRELFIEKII